MSAGLRHSEKAHCRRADGLRPAACRIRARENYKLSDKRYTRPCVVHRHYRYPDSPHNPIGDTGNGDTSLPLRCWRSRSGVLVLASSQGEEPTPANGNRQRFEVFRPPLSCPTTSLPVPRLIHHSFRSVKRKYRDI